MIDELWCGVFVCGCAGEMITQNFGHKAVAEATLDVYLYVLTLNLRDLSCRQNRRHEKTLCRQNSLNGMIRKAQRVHTKPPDVKGSTIRIDLSPDCGLSLLPAPQGGCADGGLPDAGAPAAGVARRHGVTVRQRPAPLPCHGAPRAPLCALLPRRHTRAGARHSQHRYVDRDEIDRLVSVYVGYSGVKRDANRLIDGKRPSLACGDTA